jgi:hypothetical protein
MVVKQVRPLPLPTGTGVVVPFLVNEATDYCVFQGEYGDVFGNHRLKSQWKLRTRNLRLTDADLQQSVYANSQLDYINGATIDHLAGPPNDGPSAIYSIAGNVARDSWAIGEGNDRRTFQLETTLIRQVAEGANPVLTSADFAKQLIVNYAAPQPTLTQSGTVTTTTQEHARLVPWPVRTPGCLLQNRTLSNGAGVTVQTSFYWPEDPHLAAGYTAPLVEWVETRITGLTSAPIVLHGYYSQTYRPEHHNFGENFIFEPRLEEGMPAATLAELAAANIQFICCIRRAVTPEIWALGYDKKLRRLL